MAKRFLLAVLLFSLPVILTGSVPRIVFPFDERPNSSAEWEITTQFNNHIGDEITIIVRVTTAPGIHLEFDRFPDVGESFDLKGRWLYDDYDLWRRLDRDAHDSLISYSGELEVLERTITRHHQGDSVVTEVVFKLLYLDPIDFSRAYTSKRLEGYYSIRQQFLFLTKQGNVRRGWRHVSVSPLEFQILRRVEADDLPIFSLIQLPINALRLPSYLKILGVGVIASAVVSQLWVSVKAIRKNRREKLLALESQTVPPTLQDLCEEWVQTGLYSVFLQAVILYRRGFWGKRWPVLWVKTTYVLYSGRVLSNQQVEEMFRQFAQGGEK